MKDPRYSIIPAGAVTDPALEGRDLQVLCFLGMHTDKLGWCFLSQVRMAETLECGRGTVQRSLARLVTAGWVEQRTAAEKGLPYACLAYRVIMDRDDPKLGPSDAEIEDQGVPTGEHPCPPAGTPAQPRAGTPAQPYVGTERPKQEVDDDGDARARILSDDALAIASEVGVICGFATAMDWPTGWATQAPYRVQAWLNAGWERDAIIAGSRDAMARKRDGPPSSINYFAKPIATWIARRDQPLPEVKVQERETIHVVRKTDSPARDEFRNALGELKDYNRGSRARGGGSGAPLQLLPPDRDR